jgi:hypothetical protein
MKRFIIMTILSLSICFSQEGTLFHAKCYSGGKKFYDGYKRYSSLFSKGSYYTSYDEIKKAV